LSRFPRVVTISRTIAAPPESVWEVLVDLEAWPKWGPTVRRAELIDAERLALGTTGTVWTALGVALPFTISEFEEGRHWAWRVAGVSATSHDVRPAPAGSTLRFGVPWYAPAYLAVCDIALRRIDDMVSAER